MRPIVLAGMLCASVAVYAAIGTGAAAAGASLIALVWMFGSATSKPLQTTLHAERTLDRDLVTPDEWIKVRTQLKVKGALGLRWFRLADGTGESATVAGQSASLRVARAQDAVEVNYRLAYSRRGSYSVGPAKLEYGDLMGLSRSETHAGKVDVIDVHPRLLPIATLGLPSNVPFGDELAHRRDFEDVSRPVGMRAYVPGDAPNRVHWPGTARTGNLMVREFDSSSLPITVLTLDRNRASYANEREYEWAFTVLASLFVSLRHMEVGLWLDEELQPGSGPDLERRGLRSIARAKPSAVSLGNELVRPLPWRSTLLAVVGRSTAEDRAAIEMMRRRGHRVAVVCTRMEGSPDIAAVSDSFAVARNENDLRNLQFTVVRR